MRAIAGGHEYMGSLHQVEIVFNKVPNVIPIKAVYNLVELTRKHYCGNISLCSNWDADSVPGGD